jgi:hypothetical protein
MQTPRGRQPKSHLAIRPKLAEAFRQVARAERRQLSDIFKEMFETWLKRSGKKYEEEIDLNDD